MCTPSVPFVGVSLVFYLYQSVLVKILYQSASCLLNFLIPSALEYMIYLAFSILQILFLLGTGNFSQIQCPFWGWCLPYFLISVVINFLAALEEAYKSSLDRRVFLYFYSVSFLV